MSKVSEAPRIRIDDFPSGVRPIAKDRSKIETLLRSIDSLGMPYVLGIVPAICDERDFIFLNSLQNMVPAMHGITHNYFQFSEVCRSNNDEKNEYSVQQQFNELRSLPIRMRLPVLIAYRRFLSKKLDTPVEIYIPPCNKVTLLDTKFLKKAGFEIMYCQKRKLLTFLPSIRSHFYGISKEAKKDFKSIALHITWESDLESNNSLLNLLNSMRT
jgi:hypothetical protein